MKHFEITVIGSVEPGKPYSQKNLDRLEGKMRQQLMTMDYQGGINLRDDVKKRRHGN